MIATILSFAHSIFGILAFATGVIALYRLFRGELQPRLTAVFLQATLLASAAGLCRSLTQASGERWPYFAPIFAVALAVYAWRGRRLNRKWTQIFAASLIAAFCLNLFAALVVVDQLCLASFSSSMFPWAGIVMLFLFGTFSGMTAVRIHGRSAVINKYNR